MSCLCPIIHAKKGHSSLSSLTWFSMMTFISGWSWTKVTRMEQSKPNRRYRQKCGYFAQMCPTLLQLTADPFIMVFATVNLVTGLEPCYLWFSPLVASFLWLDRAYTCLLSKISVWNLPTDLFLKWYLPFVTCLGSKCSDYEPSFVVAFVHDLGTGRFHPVCDYARSQTGNDFPISVFLQGFTALLITTRWVGTCTKVELDLHT